MKNAACASERRGHARTKLFSLSTILLLSLGLFACSTDNSDNAYIGKQRHLIAELEKNRVLWEEAGVTQYSFELAKDCDCPDELKTTETIAFDYGDEEPITDEEEILDKPGGLGARALRPREDGDDDRRRIATNQTRNIQALFTDLRQAILQNAVQQVAYDPVYGFPQNVVVNAAQPIVQNNNRIRQLDDDDDDDNRTPLSNLSIQTRNFQVLGRANAPQNLAVNGQFIRQNVNGTNQFWVVDDDGRWNQLNVPSNVFQNVNNLPNQAPVRINGQWVPGGINGQGLINLQNIAQLQNANNFNNLNGTLYYSTLDDDDYSLDRFYVTNDAGRNVFLNLPSNLQNKALQLAGQRVRLNGNWASPYNANNPNPLFNPTGINTLNAGLDSFTGVLSSANQFSLPGIQQSNYVLVNDYGAILELQIPPNLVNNIAYSLGQRVEVVGTQVYAGNYGQPIIYVQNIRNVQNVYTNTQISGTISNVLPSNGFSSNDRVVLQLDTGNTITVQIPANFRDPYNPIAAGMRILVSGAWLNNTAFGQGEFIANAPVQITNFGYNSNTTYSGYVTNIGSASNNFNCNANQNVYGFTTDSGQQLQLYITNTTQITGQNYQQGLGIPFQSRIQVTGTMVSPGVLQAQTVNVAPQFETTITGTIIEIGPAGNTFTCTGSLSTYRLLDNNGNAYLITTTPNSVVQGSLGSFLRIGDVVQVSGTMPNNGGTFYARQILSLGNSGNTPFPNNPNIGNTTQLTGTVLGLCSSNFTESYHFVDQSGSVYKLNVNPNNLNNNVWLDVGSSIQVTGNISGTEINAQQVVQLATFADPANRTPLSGTILSMTNTSTNACTTPLYTYQFQGDNGQIQQLRVSNEAAQHQAQPIANGSRVTVLSRVNSINTQVINALEIQFGNNPNFGFGNTGQNITLRGTITANGCNNEYYFVDQNGTGYRLQLNNNNLGTFAGIGSRVSVTGQIVGSQLIANNVYPDQSQTFFPSPAPISGTITSIVTTETLNCGTTITTYNFQNDNGRVQRLRMSSSVTNSAGQFINVGSRVTVNNRVESFDGSVIDALSVSQQNFF